MCSTALGNPRFMLISRGEWEQQDSILMFHGINDENKKKNSDTPRRSRAISEKVTGLL